MFCARCGSHRLRGIDRDFLYGCSYLDESVEDGGYFVGIE